MIVVLLFLVKCLFCVPSLVKVFDDISTIRDVNLTYTLPVNNFVSDDKTPIFMEISLLPDGIESKFLGLNRVSYISAGDIFRSVELNENQDLAYIAEGGNGFHIYDISDITSPQHEKTIGGLYSTLSIAEDEFRTYAFCNQYFFNATEPSEASLITTYGVTVHKGSFGNNFDYYYVRDEDKIEFVDISDIENPNEVSSISIGENEYGNLALQPSNLDFVFSVTMLGGTTILFSILNISDVENPEVIFEESFPGTLFSYISATDNDLVIFGTIPDGLRIYNVSNKTSPELLSVVDEHVAIQRIEVSGDYLAVCDTNNGLHIWNIYDPSNPYKLTEYISDLGNEAYDAAFGNDDNGTNFISYSNGRWAQEFLTFGDFNLSGIPTVNGEYTVQVEGRDATGSVSTTFTISVMSEFPLCESTAKTLCVQVNPDHLCYNCEFTSLQAAVNSLDSSGEYRIYLVGSETDGEIVNMTESVVLNASTPEDYSLANIIEVYPGHSIEWFPDGDKSILIIEDSWWKVTGGESGGTLKFINYDEDIYSVETPMIDLDSMGVLLERFSMENMLDDLWYIIYSYTVKPFDGLLISEITFSGLLAHSCISLRYVCEETCTSSSFTDVFGEGKRLWIQYNNFEHDSWQFIRTYGPAFTIEGNYFTGSGTGIRFDWEAQDGISVYNNIFHITTSWSSIIYAVYRQIGYNVVYGKNRIFNNLIALEDGGSIDSIVRFARYTSSVESSLGDPIYFYNNLIKSTGSCIPIANCKETNSVVNLYFKNNRFTEETCDSEDLSSEILSTCNVTAVNNLVDEGGNDFLSLTFNLSGDFPYPYFQPEEVVWGLPFQNPPNQSWGYEYILPQYDYLGRSRIGVNPLNYTTIGPFEFQEQVSGGEYYPLCDDSKTYCVEISELFPCSNCNSTSLQTVLDGIDGDGEYTIYLIGADNEVFDTVPAELVENVIINTGTVEDISLVNTILPYPGTSVLWKNSGDSSILDINTYWWKITGEGGYLEISASGLSSGTRVIAVDGGGVFLENFHLTNLVDDLQNVIKIENPMGQCKGIMLDGITFTETTTTSLTNPLDIQCGCDGGCADTSFTTEYGTDKRVWVKNNKFMNANTLYFIYAHGVIFLEKNYFKIDDCTRVLVFDHRYSEEAVTIQNNIFHFTSQTEEVKEIFNVWNYKEGVYTNYGYTLFYNNLIYLEDGAKLWTILDRQAVSNPSDCDVLPVPVYIYNNLIRSPICFKYVGCEATCGGGDAAHVYYKYNYFSTTNETCYSYDFGDHGGSCDNDDSLIVDDGNNNVGSDATFYLTGDAPIPYFDLKKEQFGMPLSLATSTYVLPEDDFVGRVRGPFDEITSVGASEFVCPSSCLSPFQSWCHNVEDCSCLDGYYGSSCMETSSLFEFQSGPTNGTTYTNGNYSICNSESGTLPPETEGWPGRPGGRSQLGGAVFGSRGSEVMYMFGGYGYGEDSGVLGVLGDLWSYDFNYNIWCYIKGAKIVDSFQNEIGTSPYDEFDENHNPGSRSSYSYFSTSFSFFMFSGMKSGGYFDLGYGTNSTNELWELMTVGRSRHHWRLLQPERLYNDTSDEFPSPRSSSCAAKMTISDSDIVYIFGGGRYQTDNNNAVLLNDLWTYDIQMNTFNQQRSGNIELYYFEEDNMTTTEIYDLFNILEFNESLHFNPPSRTKHICWVGLSNHLGNFYIFGGNLRNGQSVNDVWSWNVTSNSWGWIHGDKNTITSDTNVANTYGHYDSQNSPSARSSSLFFLNQQTLYDVAQGFLFFGGLHSTNEITYNDIWAFSTSLWEFKLVNGTSIDGNQDQVIENNMIGSRYSGVGVVSAYDNSLFIFGGEM